jgi:hypothetical protein
MDNESVYSYDAEDAEQFIKNINGRLVLRTAKLLAGPPHRRCRAEPVFPQSL